MTTSKICAQIVRLFSSVDGCAAALVLAALLCNGPQEGAHAQTVDTSRVVAIGGAVTEILYALGLEKRIVGVDTTSLYPPDVLRTIPNVGYMRALSAEGILSLKPSCVIAVEGAGPPTVLKLVADAGVPIAPVADEPTPDGVTAKIDAVGRLMGELARASALAADVRARFTTLGTLRARIAKPTRVLFLLSLQNGRPMVGGRGSSADAMIRLAGAVNAADAVEGFKQMSDEAIVAAAPDVILEMANGNHAASADDVFALPAFAATPAAAHRTLITMDGLYLLGFGPRTPDAVRDLMAALYPSLMPTSMAPVPKR